MLRCAIRFATECMLASFLTDSIWLGDTIFWTKFGASVLAISFLFLFDFSKLCVSMLQFTSVCLSFYVFAWNPLRMVFLFFSYYKLVMMNDSHS